jgi:O-antigen/teichoic acid export membrane protein
MSRTNEQIVGEGATYISIQIITSLTTGYLFWFILSKISTPEVIGAFAVTVSFADIFANVAIMGISYGVQPFLGKSFSEGNLRDAKVFVKASLILLSLGIITTSTLIIIARDGIYSIFKINFTLLAISISILSSSSIYILLNSIVISSLKTKVLPKIMIISSVSKIIVATILVSIGGGVIGLAIGYTFFGQILSAILLGVVIIKFLKSLALSSATRSSSSSSSLSFSSTEKETNMNNSTVKKSQSEVSFVYAFKKIWVASAVSWIPLLVPTIGSDLGTLVLFGTHGSNQAGVYFIALTIFMGITNVTYSLFTIGLPTLSSMLDGRKRLTWHTIRLSLIISFPLSSALIFYSREVLQLIGHQYVQGSLSLQVLLSSILPSSIMTGIDTLVYSYGNYRQSLLIGLAMNIPRTVLYFILVPVYGSLGTAMSYTAGSMIGFVVSIIIAKRIKMLVDWKSLAFIIAIPSGIAFTLNHFQVNYIIGIALTIIFSYLLLLKLRILTGSDLRDSIGILPYNMWNRTIRLFNKVEKRFSRFFS